MGADGPIGIGILGLGTAGRMLIPAIDRHPNCELRAVADLSDEVCAEIAAGRDIELCEDIEGLVRVEGVDAVYIATPTPLHAEHTRIAAAAGKHVVVEKPIAVNLTEAQAMIDAADKAGVVLLVGHSRSFDPAFRKMREIVDSGRIGRVRMIHHLSYTDWIYRPRRPEELQSALGGGITFRQGAHQFDVIRLLGGGLVKTVRARTGDWDPARPTTGAHTAFLTFDDGTVATAVYSGYGGFSSAELTFGIDERGFQEAEDAIGAARRAFEQRKPGSDEFAAKRKRSAASLRPAPPHHPMFGLTLVSCEGGDLRQSPHGVYLYDAQGRCEIAVEIDRTGRNCVVEELDDVLHGRRPALHDGRWGLANLEICMAVVESAKSGREVRLGRQVAVPSRWHCSNSENT